MTIREMAEKEYPPNWAQGIDLNQERRSAYYFGLVAALELAAQVATEEKERQAELRSDERPINGNMLWAAYDGGYMSAETIEEEIRALGGEE